MHSRSFLTTVISLFLMSIAQKLLLELSLLLNIPLLRKAQKRGERVNTKLRIDSSIRLHFKPLITAIRAIVSRCKRTSTLTTVSKPAHRRFLQLIHVKGAAVLDFNVVSPSTTIVCPVVTNFTSHFTVCNRRMLSFDPSRGMRTTTTHRWTWSGHLWVTSNTSKAIPARGDIFLITSDWVLWSERLEAVCGIEALVVATWVIRCNCWNNR